MYSKILNSIFALSVILLASCNMANNPVNPAYSPELVQIEEKWESDVITTDRLHKVYYKEFDKSGNLVLLVHFDNNSDTTSKSIYSYEKDLSTEQHIAYNEVGEIVENCKIKYFYNNSKLIEKKKYDNDGELQVSWTFDYNNHGHLIQTKQNDIEKGTSYTKTIKNQYNNSGELTEISYEIDSSVDPNPNQTILTKDSIVYTNNNSIKYYKIDDKGQVNNIYSYIYDRTGQITAEIISDPSGAVKKRYDFYYTYFK